jgi:predicted anti-sigma-YlaC factor YlaD
MTCERWEAAIGAVLDGEEPGIDPALVDAHVARCEHCRTFREQAHRLRRFQLDQVAPQPDLAPRVVKTAQILDGARHWSIARVVLAICAIEVIALSIPGLVGADADHSSRHLGAFSVAFGVALLVVVARPARAHAMLPVALVLAIALAVSAVVDLVNGQVPLLTEARHLPELISVVMLWLLATPTYRVRGHHRRPDAVAGLRAVPSHVSDPGGARQVG